MTYEEVAPYVGKPVRLTLADGRVLAGTIHPLYAIVSDPVLKGGKPAREILQGPGIITEVLDASDDAAAVE